jgi:hypothetical protein
MIKFKLASDLLWFRRWYELDPKLTFEIDS